MLLVLGRVKVWSGGPDSHRSPRGHNAVLCLIELRT